MMLNALIMLGGGLSIIAVVLVGRWLEAAAWRSSLQAIELHPPLGLAPADVARWLDTVAAATHPHRLSLVPDPPVVLEVVADQHIRHVLLVPRALRDTVLGGLRAALPGVRVSDLPGYLDDRSRLTVATEAVQTSQRWQMGVERASATATAVLATLQPLGEHERIVVQWIVTGAGTPAPVPSMTSGHKRNLPGWLAGEEVVDGETVRSARAKQQDMMLRAALRIGVQAPNVRRANAILARVWSQHRGENSPGVVLNRRWWMGMGWAPSRLASLRIPVTTWPLLLSTREAAGLLPIPVGEVALPGVALGLARQLPPPPEMQTTTGVQVGVSNYPDMHLPLRLAVADRLQHLHVLGPTGVGKSTLLANLIIQDIAAGYGVVVIDPKSDLVAAILERVPEHRLQDIIVADAAATERPVSFNLLRSAHDEQSRELVVDHVIHIWHELYKDFWGPRSEDVLRGALLSLINTRGSNGESFTLIETPELLTNNPFRKFVTEQDGVPPALASFWAWYRGLLPAERLKVVGPILNKLRAATLRTPIRLMLGQSEGLDLARVLAEKRVLLVPLSAGTLGAETAGLLGALLLASLWQAVLGRVALPQAERHPVFVHIDEAQSVLKLPVDLADMLAQARGMGVSFTLAHQHLGQIDDKQVKSALLGTVRSQVVFQTMREDAAALAPSYAPRLTADDLMGLARYEFAMRPLVNGQTLAPVTGTTLPLPPAIRDGAALTEASRERYGRPRAEVEAALQARGRAPEDDQPRPRKRSTKSDNANGSEGRPSKRQPFGRRRKAANDEDGSDSTGQTGGTS